MEEKTRGKCIITALIILFVIVFIFSLSIGRFPITLSEFLDIISSKIFNSELNCDPTLEIVLFQIRLPRIFAAILVGSALSIAGATYQSLFKNPMVSPDLLGASAGAGFGAAIALLLSFSAFFVQISSFLFGLSAVAITCLISKIITRKINSILVLVLTGMVVSNMFSAAISIIKFVADPNSKLPEITFWLMGGLSSVTMKDVLMLLFPVIFGIIPIFLLRWSINILSFGDEESKTLGIDVKKIRVVLIIASTLVTAASVAIGGMIGWIGLIIPHISRLLVGPNQKILIPASILVGAIFLLIVDNIARSAFSVEIPLGILTSLIGAPCFIFLLIKGKKGW